MRALALLVLFGLGAQAAPTPPLDTAARAEGVINNRDTNATVPTTAPKATLYTDNGEITVTGTTLLGCEAFYSIPFAEPPTGPRRFERPVPKAYTENIAATGPGPACVQAIRTSTIGNVNLTSGQYGISEDCLSLNVLAPRGTAGSDASLPVMVWIYGGGFTSGDASAYNSPFFVQRSSATGSPVVLVTVNYRLGIFEFGYGRDVADHGAANLGLRDQLLALQWVRDNIASFGGDPAKVTVFGESAGAISIALLMLDENVDLFRGAIMQSGAAGTTPLDETSDAWNEPYNFIAGAVGCLQPNGTAQAQGNMSTWECLKTVPAQSIQNATEKLRALPQYNAAYVFAPSIDGDLVKDSPRKLLKEGKFANIPFITGSNRDEGTLFTPTSVDKTTFPLALQLIYPEPVPQNASAAIFAAYPNDPTMGSPFGTGNDTFGLDPAFKQVAAIAGDMGFHSRRRQLLRQANRHGNKQTWSYDFWGPTPNLAPFLGIMHGTDIFYMLGIATQALNYTAEEEAMGNAMMDYWINFAYALDPNGGKGGHGHGHGHGNHPRGKGTDDAKQLPHWPAHSFPRKPNSLRLIPGNITVVPDTFREKQMAVFDVPSVAEALFFKRAGGQ